MNIEEIIKLIDAIAALLGVLVWPGVVVFLLVRFGPSLREFVSGLGEFSLKGPGFEASARRQQAEAAAALAAAEASRPAGDLRSGMTPNARSAAGVIAAVATPRVIRRTIGSKVLWVDDRPNNNIYERQALEALGVSFVLAQSTDEALQRIMDPRNWTTG